MGDNLARLLLAALEDDLVAERFRLILQPTIDNKLEPARAFATDCARPREVRDLRDHAEALEQHGRRASVRVFGIPEDTQGTTDDELLNLCNNRKKIRPPLSPDDIEVSHRVGKLVATVPNREIHRWWGPGPS